MGMYAQMNEMAGWNGTAAGSRSLDKETCKCVLPSWTPSIYSLFIFNFASFHSSSFNAFCFSLSLLP